MGLVEMKVEGSFFNGDHRKNFNYLIYDFDPSRESCCCFKIKLFSANVMGRIQRNGTRKSVINTKIFIKLLEATKWKFID